MLVSRQVRVLALTMAFVLMAGPWLGLEVAPGARADSAVTMPVALPQEMVTAAAVWDGRYAYVFGGYDASGANTDRVVRYDPQAQTVVTMGARLPKPLSGVAAVWDGTYAYVIGGCCVPVGGENKHSRDIVRYDPAADSTSVMGAKLPTGRNYVRAVWTGSAVYIVGGNQAEPGKPQFMDEIVRFDPAADSIAVMGARIPWQTSAPGAAYIGGKVYILGGGDPFGKDGIARYDPATDTIVTMGARLKYPSGYVDAASDGTDVYVFGGCSSASCGGYTNEIFRYKPATDTLTTAPAVLPSARLATTSAWAEDEAFVFSGSQQTPAMRLRDIVRYRNYDNLSPPVAVIAPTAPAECASGRGTLSLDGSSSYDPEGKSLRYTWSAAGITFSPPGGARTSASFPFGATSVALRVSDADFSTTATATARVADSLAPTIAAGLAGVAGNSGWWRSAVTASITTGDQCGVAGEECRVDGRPAQSCAGLVIGGEGSHSLHYLARDLGGNVAEGTASFGIDTVPPTTAAAFAGLRGNAGWWRSAVDVALTATDATSGVASTTHKVDGQAAQGISVTVAGDGIHELRFASTDAAGNGEPERSATLRLDGTPPSTAASLAGLAGTNGWWRSAVTATLVATDATSGVEATRNRVDGGAYRLGASADIVGDGTHVLEHYSSDVAGNDESARALDVRIDATPPTVSLDVPEAGAVYVNDLRVPLAQPLPLTLVVGTHTVRMNASDAVSGVDRVELYVDGLLKGVDSAAPYEVLWRAGEEALGPHRVEARAVDRAGNAASQAREVTTLPTAPQGLAATAQAGAALLPDPGEACGEVFQPTVCDQVPEAPPLPVVPAPDLEALCLQVFTENVCRVVP